MAARPPPARPHIGLNPTNQFSSYSVTEWAEDDAWDSGSDEESPSSSGWTRPTSTNSRQASSTAPKPVPRPGLNNSSSTLAFSYTHVHAPSSYPPKTDQPSKAGWTIVSKATERQSPDIQGTEILSGESLYEDPDGDAEGDMVVGHFEPEVTEKLSSTSNHRSRQDQAVVREDAQDIVDGVWCYPVFVKQASVYMQIRYI